MFRMTSDEGSFKVSPEMEQCGPLLWTKLEIVVEACPGSFGRVFFHKVASQIQEGPTCGFVGLILAARSAGLVPEEKYEVDLKDVLAWARMVKFTNMGEMFSADWLARIGNEFYTLGKFETMNFPTASEIVKYVNEQQVFLVPYDCDKNFEPIERNGEGAHWAAVVGYFLMHSEADDPSKQIIRFEKVEEADNVKEDELFVVAYQGKSKHPALWKFTDLKKSNFQLRIADTKKAASFQLPKKENPEDPDLFGLLGKVVKVNRK